MSKKTTLRLVIYMVVLFLIYWVIYFIVLFQVKKAFQDINEKDTQFVYQDLSVSLLQRSVIITGIDFSKGKKININAQSVELLGIDPIEFIKDHKINVSSLVLDTPEIVINPNVSASKNKNTTKETNALDLYISESIIKNGSFKIIHKDSTLIVSEGRHIEGLISEFILNKETEANTIPFDASDFEFTVDSLVLPVDPYHKLSAHTALLSRDVFEIRRLHVLPLLSKDKFHQSITTERDYMNLKGKLLKVKAPLLSNRHNNTHFSSGMITLDQFYFDIYRDKRIADDTTIKPLYSSMLRELDTKITIDSIAISNSTIVYTEHPDSDADAGVLEFHNITLHSGVLSNVATAKPVRIKIDASFMNQAPMQVEWRFDVADSSDAFNINGSFKNIQASSLNSFLTPVMQVKSMGALDRLYFNFDGNRKDATGAMHLSFNRFDISIYDQETKKIKSFLSTIANMIIGGQEDNGMQKKEGISVERDPTKSFWNYFWLCIRNGLFDIII